MNEEKTGCKVCGDKEGEIKYHMCDYCREALRKKHPGFNRIISRMEERLQKEDENREEILSRLAGTKILGAYAPGENDVISVAICTDGLKTLVYSVG